MQQWKERRTGRSGESISNCCCCCRNFCWKAELKFACLYKWQCWNEMFSLSNISMLFGPCCVGIGSSSLWAARGNDQIFVSNGWKLNANKANFVNCNQITLEYNKPTNMLFNRVDCLTEWASERTSEWVTDRLVGLLFDWMMCLLNNININSQCCQHAS